MTAAEEIWRGPTIPDSAKGGDRDGTAPETKDALACGDRGGDVVAMTARPVSPEAGNFGRRTLTAHVRLGSTLHELDRDAATR